ncbi:MAG: hypothetical protein IT365_01640 [Candidatus Hydrogenedentes bacterium]|nr:hypothetical protein [Candidatus Hydrogenedentota bacterium]
MQGLRGVLYTFSLSIGLLIVLLGLTGCPDTGGGTPNPDPGEEPGTPEPQANPILFVTQTPHYNDFTTIVSTFGNQQGHVYSAPRGGDLYIRYPDGVLRNLTQEAGFGTKPEKDIAVRDPHVHWNGSKALFSMVVGGTTKNDYTPVYFQIYEVTGLGKGEAVNIRRLKQPKDFNNVAPSYDAVDRILFTSDRPHNGDRRLYPQLDEYESAKTVSGLWRMNADGSDLHLLDHSPSGDFEPFVDSFGRIVFTRWDHLQRDQQADADIAAMIEGEDPSYDAVTYESEDSDVSHALAPGDEVYPEPRAFFDDPTWDELLPTEQTHTFNVFFPWMMNHDGTGLETLNHIGRLELSGYIPSARTYLPEAYAFSTPRIRNVMHLAEDPTKPGRYYMSNVLEFGTHAAGQIVSLNAKPSLNADDMRIKYETHTETSSYVEDGENPGYANIGLFRDPLPTTDGTLWAVHSSSPYRDDATASSPPSPAPFEISSRYDFSIRQLVPGGPDGTLKPGARLNPGGIVEDVSYFDNYRYRTLVYSGRMWELQPVEVVARARPKKTVEVVPDTEQAVMEQALGGAANVSALREYLVENNLALLVCRDVTVRGDEQQDINLKIAWSDHKTSDGLSTPKEIAWLQFFEGQQLRGYRSEGRRVIARAMDDAVNPAESGAPEGAVRLGDDGSMAAFVPARRALSWQTTELDGTPAVRERFWLTFQPGEIRSCTNCHGLNEEDVFGGPVPENPPQALADLMQWWLAQ